LGGDNYYYPNPPPQYGYGGLFVASSSSSHSVVLDSNGEASAELRVSMQPGDNYRVAGTVFPISQLGILQSANGGLDGYVSAYIDWIRGGFNGALSPLLTVWRKLHLEIDSMTAPPTNGPQANFRTAKIGLIKQNLPKGGQSVVTLQFNGQVYSHAELEGGTMGISGSKRWTPLLIPRDAIFKLVFGEVCSVFSLLFYRASIH
jgi:hypothetical protein